MEDPAQVAKIEDPQRRALAAHRLIDDYQAAITEFSRIRRDALEELMSTGMNQTQLATLLDVSRSRVSQLLSAGVRPERTFLGTGRLTVAVGTKLEVGRSDPGSVVSTETFAAYNVLAELARSVGLDTEYEVVPPPGLVQLNRPNLVVLTSPRLLPFLSQVLDADPRLRFAQDERGWYLIDAESGSEYRSGRESGNSDDYAYVGRLPRPDGKGTFLYLAGIHAQGTLAAAQYIADNLPTLFKELKGRRFSTLVKCVVHGTNVATIERITPLYRHEAGA